jgi:integrase
MRKVLTPRFVESVRPKTVRTEYPDAACPGLYLVLQPSGTRSWAHRFRHNGVNGKRTLGRAGAGGLSLAAARAAVANHRHRLERDPVAPVTPVTPFSGGGEDKVETAIASFLERYAYAKTRRSTATKAEQILNREVLSRWRGRKLNEIRRADVIDLVEDIAASGRGYLANRTLAQLSKLFNWLVARDVLAISPVTGVERPFQEKARTRVLEDAELRALWNACQDDGPFGDAVRALTCAGARRDEVGRMRWSELDETTRTWKLPGERSKNGREHVIPLSTQAWDLIWARPRFAGCPYVFTADGKTAINGWHKAKLRISAKAGIAPKSWRVHDLRRTCASGMQRLGTPVAVIEKALNHVSGVFRGITGVYQQHDYADEVRIALQKWSDHVERVVGGRPGKVVKLHQR